MLAVWSIEQREEPLNVCKLPNGMLTVDRLGGLDVFGHHHRCFRCWLRQLAWKWLLRQQTKRLQTFKVVSHYVSNTLFDSRWHPSEGCWLLYIHFVGPRFKLPLLISHWPTLFRLPLSLEAITTDVYIIVRIIDGLLHTSRKKKQVQVALTCL